MRTHMLFLVRHVYVVRLCLVQIPSALPRHIKDARTIKLLPQSCTAISERILAATAHIVLTHISLLLIHKITSL